MWESTDGKGRTAAQTAFLLLPNREAFYGGAAGGGKSDALLMAGLQYVDIPGYAALILRKSFTDLQLPGAIMDRAYQWLADRDDCEWSERDHRWTFEGGGVLQFGYLEHKRDRYRYQSAEFQYVGFDELTQFDIDEYLYLATRLRRLAGAKVPVRMRSASNPGGVGHEWVKARFIPQPVQHLDGKVEIVYPRDEDGQRIPFIPARLEDNPNLDQADYEISLRMVDPILRAQMRRGEWSAAKPGTKFRREWFIHNIIEVAPRLVKRAAYGDLASTEDTGNNDPDWTSYHWGGMTAEGKLVIEGGLRLRGTPAMVETATQTLAGDLNPEMPGAYPFWVEQEPGSAGKAAISNYQRRVLPGYVVRGHRPTGEKWVRADLLAAMAERGDVLLVRGPWISAFIEELVAFSEDGTHSHDDQVDSATGLATALFKAAEASSHSYIDAPRAEVIRRGDLVLRGTKYVDKVPSGKGS